MLTLIEDLPDEILLIICRYLHQYYIIFGLLGLNYRLNCTISQYIQSLVVFHEDSKYILSIVGPSLRSLTIKQYRLSSEEISLASNIEELTFIQTDPDCLPVLKNLTDLNILYGPSFQSVNSLFSKINNIHSIYIASTNPLTIPLFSPRKISRIKQLSITLQSSKDFIRLLNLCPELTCLNLTLQDYKLDEQILNEDILSNLRIFSFRTSYDCNVNFNELKNLFKYLPSQIEHLSFEIHTNEWICLDGNIWENYLKETFKELNYLQFFILYRKGDTNDFLNLKVIDILKTFQSIYWSKIVHKI